MAPRKKAPETLEWRAWPLVQYPVRSALGLALAAAAVATIYVLLRHVGLTVIFGAALLTSLHGHLLPRRYRLDDEGATVKVLGMKRTRPWDYFHSYYDDRLGVMLSTFAYPSRLDTFRGVNLRFAPDNRERVVAFAAARLPRAFKVTRAERRAARKAGE